MRMPVVSLTQHPEGVGHVPCALHNPRASACAAGEHVAGHTSTATMLALENLVLGQSAIKGALDVGGGEARVVHIIQQPVGGLADDGGTVVVANVII